MKYVLLTEEHWSELLHLWATSGGLLLRAEDDLQRYRAIIARNPGVSLGANIRGHLVGAVLGGHDGYRGNLYHLAVAPGWRRHGIGTQLVERVTASLRAEGIGRVHVLVETEHSGARDFWNKRGFQLRLDVKPMTLVR